MTALDHLSEVALQRCAVTPPAASEPAGVHLAACARCQEAIAEIKEAHATFAREVFPKTRDAVVQRATGAATSPGWRVLILSPVLAVALVVAVSRWSAEPAIGIKGAPTFAVFAKRGERVTPVAPGDTLMPGDRLRFQAESAGFGYLLVVAIDGSGATSVYVPFGGSASVAIDATRPFLSEDSVELDESPGPERAYALFSRKPLAAASVLEALRAVAGGRAANLREGRTLPVPADAQVSLLWEKERR